MNKVLTVLGCLLMVALVVLCIAYAWVPGVRATINQQAYEVQKADDATLYSTRKQVEDTCRAMIASYDADVLTWEQYNGSENEERQSWADQARMRANRTASTYNEYVLKNSHVWECNIPADIFMQLAIITDQ